MMQTEKKCPSCLAGFSREDIKGNCTCNIPQHSHERWREAFDKMLPLIVEDYNNFIAEAGEIGELDIEEIVSERLLPFIAKTRREAERGKEELVDALISMYSQYCPDGHDFMSAGEQASTILELQGYARFDDAGRMLNSRSQLDNTKEV